MPVRIAIWLSVWISCGMTCLAADIPPLPHVDPAAAGLDPAYLNRISDVVEEGLQQHKMPGAVVLVGYQGQIVWHKAYGQRAVEPELELMSEDTIFDLASLTKPIATATSIMLLVEQGDLRLRDRLADHFPNFGQNGKDEITVFQLLTHQGGFIPDNAASDYLEGPEQAFQNIFALEPKSPPGTKFVYSDVGFIVLGELVKQVSGKSVHEFSQERIFQPLGLKDTQYLPPAESAPRIAPTQKRDEQWMRGQVHDPRSHLLGGVAGHAGLFSTASDLAVYAQMLLNKGSYQDVRVMSPRTVEVMTQSYTSGVATRGLGWDKLSSFSTNRGEFFSDRAFGHSGFTGTSIWIDPEYDLFVIVLSNRVHPNGKGSVNQISGRIGTLAVASIRELPVGPALGRSAPKATFIPPPQTAP